MGTEAFQALVLALLREILAELKALNAHQAASTTPKAAEKKSKV